MTLIRLRLEIYCTIWSDIILNNLIKAKIPEMIQFLKFNFAMIPFLI